MNIDLLELILCAFFTAFSFYAWRSYSDDQSFWLASLGVAIISLLLVKLLLLHFLPENIKTVLDAIIWLSWLPLFIALIVIARGTKGNQ
jgi:hypothetical protein